MTGRYTIQYGLIVGLITILVRLLFGGTGFLGLIFLGTGIYYAAKRDITASGSTSPGRMLVLGFFISLISGIVISIYTWADLYVNQHFLKEVLNEAAYFLEDAGIEGNTFDEVMDIYEKVLTPFWISVFGLGGQIFVGALLSLFNYFLLRKHK